MFVGLVVVGWVGGFGEDEEDGKRIARGRSGC